MYHILLLIGFFVIFFAICMVVYIAVVRAYYWGDKDEAPKTAAKKDDPKLES
ncbi:MAG: hypothetical protein UZ17_ACD001002831 [Acidobacteria bacterium OLB17]|nr:MAG: hypothetical protein UZ17_ACD001002831 [Acidobacteria bacterium OLB17]MCZ2391187.1 hypothetical protein [Acidobacteriota bacterium]